MKQFKPLQMENFDGPEHLNNLDSVAIDAEKLKIYIFNEYNDGCTLDDIGVTEHQVEIFTLRLAQPPISYVREAYGVKPKKDFDGRFKTDKKGVFARVRAYDPEIIWQAEEEMQQELWQDLIGELNARGYYLKVK